MAHLILHMQPTQWYATEDLVVLEIILCTASRIMKLHMYESIVFKRGPCF